MDAGVDINAKNSDGVSLLQLAAQVGQKEILELLISKGADINTKDVVGWTPVIEAARKGHKAIVELLISHGALLNTKDSLTGKSALHFAAALGHKEMVQLLISKGADVNIRSDALTFLDIFKTPLDMADDKEIADLLRKHGAKTGEELKAEGK